MEGIVFATGMPVAAGALDPAMVVETTLEKMSWVAWLKETLMSPGFRPSAFISCA
ncbi:hypothetical protein [Burkholderia sp. PAMC 28687]|uniref:hypothetical protein n=1 Tax=Burkholderia sp. PAMC 28687 TaxID=1795874 RepID=UPI0012D7C286|nr:hypothetical protein [Burkholderia sp. PAMC 28687]